MSGALDVWGNASLANLDGLIKLTSAGDVYIGENDIITNLDGLSRLTTVDSLYVGKNAMLCQTIVDAYFATVTVAPMTSEDNDGPCDAP